VLERAGSPERDTSEVLQHEYILCVVHIELYKVYFYKPGTRGKERKYNKHNTQMIIVVQRSGRIYHVNIRETTGTRGCHHAVDTPINHGTVLSGT
jgi:hypothetical protein